MNSEDYERFLYEAERQIETYRRVSTDYSKNNTDARQTYAMGQEDGAKAIMFIVKQFMKKATYQQANG